ncbi:hypothetical protein [Marinobacter sp.]|uniref:hypothetical protein n=1 Tax=Marinobacter sp. TaxID=50741 RepID=UPI0035C6F5B3
MQATQSITEMALMRSEFYRGKTPADLGAMMREWVSQGVDPKEITFWETRSQRFRVVVCEVAGVSRFTASKAWAHMTEETRQSIRVALRELKTVIADGMDWRRVEVQTRKGVA